MAEAGSVSSVGSSAGSLGALSGKIAADMQSAAQMLSGLSYLMGIGFGMKALLAFKEISAHESDDPAEGNAEPAAAPSAPAEEIPRPAGSRKARG